MERDYLQILKMNVKVFMSMTESFPNPLGDNDYLFLDREFDKDVNLLFSEIDELGDANFIFLPEILRKLESPDVARYDFYSRLYDEYYYIYDDYLEPLNLPEDFRFGFAHSFKTKRRVRRVDDTYTKSTCFICCSFKREVFDEFDNDMSLFFETAIKLIGEIESRCKYLGDRADFFVRNAVVIVVPIF